jgi:hypothetical protein
MVSEAKNNKLDQMDTFASRGETSNDIITKLFTGYVACTDKNFFDCMEKYKDSYEKVEDVTYQEIMSKEERRYQARAMSD